MEDTIISWNAANWITISLMALVLFFLVGLIQKYMQQQVNGGTAAAS